jgi:hypothetical protein
MVSPSAQVRGIRPNLNRSRKEDVQGLPALISVMTCHISSIVVKRVKMLSYMRGLCACQGYESREKLLYPYREPGVVYALP